MVHKVTASEFHGRTDLPEWRVVLRRIEAGFRAPSFYDAATFVGQIASAAERARHHPDIDVRYPGCVYVSLTTHATNSLTDADIDLATTISAIAADAGLITEPWSALGVEVAIDALDIDAVRPFWKAILDYVDEPLSDPDGQVTALVEIGRAHV